MYDYDLRRCCYCNLRFNDSHIRRFHGTWACFDCTKPPENLAEIRRQNRLNYENEQRKEELRKTATVFNMNDIKNWK